MMLSEKGILLIHVPKTAGTFLEKWLLPLSDAEIVTGGWRDPEERFELKGEYTRHKHMTVDQYREAIPKEIFSQMRVLCAIRHPVQRSVSFYFSPHRWVMKKRSARVRDRVSGVFMRPIKEKPADYTTAPTVFSIERFEAMLLHMPSMTSYMMQDGNFRRPDYLISHETFESDCLKFANEIDVSPPSTFKKVNASTIPKSKFDNYAADPRVIEIVRRNYADDFDNFGYD